MKKLIVLFTLLVCSVGYSQTWVPGDRLRIGPTTPEQVNANYSGAIGQFNSMNSSYSLAVGIGNSVSGSGYSLLIGSSNQMTTGGSSFLCGWSNNNYGSYSGVTGVKNTSYANLSMVVGGLNTVGNSTGGVGSSFIVGVSNVGNVGLNSSFLGGMNNSALGTANLTMGRGLVNQWDYCSVVGKYNSYAGGTNLLLVVGNGNGIASDPKERSNALEVYADGAVIISQRQGDVGMGRFTNVTADQ